MPVMATKTESEEYEYVTYVPGGHKCADCGHEIKPLELARRARVAHRSGPPISVYRHERGCPK